MLEVVRAEAGLQEGWTMSHRQLTARWLLAAFGVLAEMARDGEQIDRGYRAQFGELRRTMKAYLGAYNHNELRDVARGRA